MSSGGGGRNGNTMPQILLDNRRGRISSTVRKNSQKATNKFNHASIGPISGISNPGSYPPAGLFLGALTFANRNGGIRTRLLITSLVSYFVWLKLSYRITQSYTRP